MTSANQTVSPVRKVDAGNSTDLDVAASGSAPSTSTSEVSNVMESSQAGQSTVGADYVASTVGPTEVVLNNTVNKGITERTLMTALLAASALGAVFILRSGRGRRSHS